MSRSVLELFSEAARASLVVIDTNADLGDSSKFSNGNFVDCNGEVFQVNKNLT